MIAPASSVYTAARMAPVICLLRAVNVGSHNRMKMDALRELFPALNCDNACTYVQSGNVVFLTAERRLPRLAEEIEGEVQRKFGFHSVVVLRSVAEMRKAVQQNPFRNRRGIQANRLLVTFLTAEPAAEYARRIRLLKADPEEIHLLGRELYIYYPNGLARPKVPWTSLEKALQVPGTARNWNTVTKLLEMAEQLERNSR